MESATSKLAVIEDPPGPGQPEEFDTPDVRTIAGLSEFDEGSSAERQIKSLFFVIDGDMTIALVRGDHGLVEQKLRDATGGVDIRPAVAEEIQAKMGALPGSLGAVGVTDLPIFRRSCAQGSKQHDHRSQRRRQTPSGRRG